jgi:hypothetical protein
MGTYQECGWWIDYKTRFSQSTGPGSSQALFSVAASFFSQHSSCSEGSKVTEMGPGEASPITQLPALLFKHFFLALPTLGLSSLPPEMKFLDETLTL